MSTGCEGAPAAAAAAAPRGAPNLANDYLVGGYDSEFESSGPRKRRRFDADIPAFGAAPPHHTSRDGKELAGPRIPNKDQFREEGDRHERRRHKRNNILSAYDQHRKYINDFVLWYGDGEKHRYKPRARTDAHVIAEEHRFVWREPDLRDMSWEKRQALVYSRQLKQDCCLVELSQYKANRIAMRWRTHAEAEAGKGTTSCAALGCDHVAGLTTWAVDFQYTERGEARKTPVAVRLCPACSRRLNHTTPHAKLGGEPAGPGSDPKDKGKGKKKTSKKRNRHKERALKGKARPPDPT